MSFILSEEQKRKIEKEEAAKVAEEAYRQEVRRSLRPATPTRRPEDSAPLAKPEHSVRFSWGFRIALALVLLLGGTWIFSAYSHAGAADNSGQDSPSLLSHWVSVTVPIVRGQVEVPPSKYLSWQIDVPGSNVRNYRVTGHYSALGGGGNDIAAVIASEDEFQNWINGHQSRAAYASPGRVTTGKIDVMLAPGRYVLAFNNRFSLFTAKAVFAEISATFEQTK